MAIEDNAIQEFIASIKPQQYETVNRSSAVVSHVDDEGVVWVNVAGSVIETPTASISSEVNAGDDVTVEWRNNKLFIVGNNSNPSAGGIRVTNVEVAAQVANELALDASNSASIARTAAEAAVVDAAIARESAESAQESATNASEYAARALCNLSTVQNVTETLNWITAHGTMTLTDDQALDPTHVYFVVDANGDYEVAGTHYSVVTEPSIDDISTYYELSIDESLNNYVGTHLAVTSEGLWLLPDAVGNKVLIATGQGSTYTSAGTYIIGKDNGSDVTLATFLASGAQIGKSDEAHLEMDFNSMQLKDLDGTAYFVAEDARDADGYVTITHNFTMGGGLIGAVTVDYPIASIVSATYNGNAVDYSFDVGTTSVMLIDSQGRQILLTQGDEVVIVYKTVGDLFKSFTFGNRSSDEYGKLTFAEGKDVQASGDFSHAQNLGTVALAKAQTVLGTYNEPDPMSYSKHLGDDVSYSWYALIIGNGTDSDRSNAFGFTWDGNIEMYLDSTNDYDLISAINALGWTNEVIV